MTSEMKQKGQVEHCRQKMQGKVFGRLPPEADHIPEWPAHAWQHAHLWQHAPRKVGVAARLGLIFRIDIMERPRPVCEQQENEAWWPYVCQHLQALQGLMPL